MEEKLKKCTYYLWIVLIIPKKLCTYAGHCQAYRMAGHLKCPFVLINHSNTPTEAIQT